MRDLEQPEWVTVREAAQKAGCNVGAIRKWNSWGEIESRLERGPFGPERRVRLADILRRAGPERRRRRDAGRSDVQSTATAQALIEHIRSLTEQLAEARERVGRLEAENEALRQRLRE